MDKEIVSLIESIKPDFSYQGSDGVLRAVMESHDNMIAIDNYIDAINVSSYDESVSEKVAELKKNASDNLGKAYDVIAEAIKAAIKKIKSLFISQFRKIQVLYNQAAEKVGATLAKLGSADKKFVPYEFEYVSPEKLKGFAAAYNPSEVANPSELQIFLKNFVSGQLNDITVDMAIEHSLANAGQYRLTDKEIENLTETIKIKCTVKDKEINISKAGLKAYFDHGVAESLKSLYKAELQSEERLLKSVAAFKNNRKDLVTDRSVVKHMNMYVEKLQNANFKYFNAINSVAISGFHGYLKHVVFAIRKNAAANMNTGKVKEAAKDFKNKAGEAAENAKSWGKAIKDTAKDFAPSMNVK